MPARGGFDIVRQLSPVHIEDRPNSVRTIRGVATAIGSFIGWSAQGPSDRAVLCSSFANFARDFGGLDPRTYLGYAVSHFFANGGNRTYVVRLSGHADDAAPLVPGEAAFSAALVGTGSRPGAFRLLDGVDQFNLLAVPGHAVPADLKILQKFCRDRRAMLIVDAAERATFNSLKHGPGGDLIAADAINAAFYFPWLVAPDPMQENRPRRFPPSGAVAGVYARTDATRGVWKAPAGADARIVEVTGVSEAVTDSQNAVLNPLAINCIRSFADLGTVPWGARTLRGSDAIGSDWKYVPVRRTALYIEESVSRGLDWTASEANGEPLWAQIRVAADTFMAGLFRAGAFQGARARDAYFVKCDSETTTRRDIDRGMVNIVVGFAPLKPAEFVVVRIQQLARRP